VTFSSELFIQIEAFPVLVEGELLKVQL